MADTNFLAGTAYLTIDGKSYMLVGSFSYRPSNATRTTLKGMDGVHGFKEEPEPGSIKAKIRDAGTVSVQALGAATNVTIAVDLANGKKVVGRNMWRAGEPPEADAEEGTIDITWEGPDVSEQ